MVRQAHHPELAEGQEIRTYFLFLLSTHGFFEANLL